MGNYLDNVSILIVGFDGYVDVWNHSIDLMNKYWPDRPKTYFATSELKPDYAGVEIIQAGPNSEWSRKTQTALSHINTPYVILLLEDFFISDYVDNDTIVETLKFIEENDIKFYQLLVQLINQKWEKGKRYEGKRYLKIIPTNKKYGINLQAAIWKTDYLREKVGHENYNAWKFEMNQLGEEHYNEDKIEFLIDTRNMLNITHTVVQSKYLRGAVRKLKKIGCVIDSDERPMLSLRDNFKYQLKLFMYSATPRFMVPFAKKVGKVMKVDFVTDRLSKNK